MNSAGGLHVVFGTGAIGLALIEELHGAGKRVRAVSRSGAAIVPDGVELARGDATDHEFANASCADAAVVYFCLNPPYNRWPDLFPPLQAAVMDGAASVDAKLVVVENLYMYGPTGGAPLTEDLPYDAMTRKGRVRAEMARELMAANAAGDLRVVVGRAADYFGPRGRASTMGTTVFDAAVAGKKAQLVGKLDMPHTYSYLPDIALGLAILGERDEAVGRAWHLPNAAPLSTREFVAMVYQAAGNQPNMASAPRPILRLIGVRNPNVRELVEMLYEFEEPFVVDDSDFVSAFGNHSTALDEAIATTVAWYRANPPQT